ncbi:accessory gland protein Acp53Ea [Drosophila rhopaloa]|uniref:Accessory gland protein Acp53Ea n=1 Tax=Drosophila rhopaloa TaxID=1041015 RepID=A0A6P4FFI4_DRORH|nr:accessory gland protein Acp53Ea [Drosophila rhopaloa]
MKLTKVTLVLCLLAIVCVAQTKAQELSWEKWLGCNRIGTKAVASLVREIIPELRTLLNCLDFSPPTNLVGSGYLGKLKLYYEFLKRSSHEKAFCLLAPLRGTVKLLRPYVNSLGTQKCLLD